MFENNEDKNFYRAKEAEVKALTEKAANTAAAIEILYGKIEELTEVYQNLNPGDTAPNGEKYTQENITDGRNAINNLNRDEENEDIKKADAEALVLNLYTININIMSNSMDFSLGVAVSDSPQDLSFSTPTFPASRLRCGQPYAYRRSSVPFQRGYVVLAEGA